MLRMSGAVLPHPIVFIACTGTDLFLKEKSSNRIAQDSYSVISHTNGGFITGEEKF
jgi:hypothetical protein